MSSRQETWDRFLQLVQTTHKRTLQDIKGWSKTTIGKVCAQDFNFLPYEIGDVETMFDEQVSALQSNTQTTTQQPVTPKKRPFADVNISTPEVKDAVKNKKLATDWDINDHRKFYQFTLSLAHHHRELRALWDKDYKKPDTESFLTDVEHIHLEQIIQAFLPLRKKMINIIDCKKEMIDLSVKKLIQEAWECLANLQLPMEHPLYTPIGFLFTKERLEVISYFAIICSFRECGFPVVNRMLCKALSGLKSTGKSTLLKTLCTLVALLFDKMVPIYADYHLGCSTIRQLFVVACELRGQDSTQAIPLACGDEFQDLWKPNYDSGTIEVQVAKEFVAFPSDNHVGMVAGSSAHLYDYLFAAQNRPQFSHYPGSWNSDKYQKILLYPLRTKDHLRNFLITVQKSPNCKIAQDHFHQITGKSSDNLSRDEVFNALVEDTSLSVILEETAGVPGGILSFLSGATPPCSTLPKVGSVELNILLELYAVNVAKSSTYDPWNPVRISQDTIRELAGADVDIENLKAELKDKCLVYEASDAEAGTLSSDRYEFCYPKHFKQLSQPDNHASKLTLYEVAVCQHYGGPKDRTNFWHCLQRLWSLGPDEKELRKLSLAKRRPADLPSNCKWIGDIQDWKDLDGSWDIRQDKGLDKIQFDGCTLHVTQVKLTKDPISDKSKGHRDSIEAIFDSTERQLNILFTALSQKWEVPKLSIIFTLCAPKLAEKAKDTFAQGLTFRFKKLSFAVKTEWIHGEHLVAMFPKRIQSFLKDKLG